MVGKARIRGITPVKKILPGRRRLGRRLEAEELADPGVERVVRPRLQKCRQEQSVGVAAGNCRAIQPDARRPEEGVEIACGVVKGPPIKGALLADRQPNGDWLIASSGAAHPLAVGGN